MNFGIKDKVVLSATFNWLKGDTIKILYMDDDIHINLFLKNKLFCIKHYDISLKRINFIYFINVKKISFNKNV